MNMGAQTNRIKVLLVEDDKIDQLAFRRMIDIKKLEYDYVIAESLIEAKELIDSTRFDIALIDYLLKDGSGFELFDLLDDTPIIIFTGVGSENLAVQALKSGAFEYVVKDISQNHLEILPELIKNAILHKRTMKQLSSYEKNIESMVEEKASEVFAERQLLSVTLASMSDGLIVIDSEKRVVLANAIAEHITGLDRETMKGSQIEKVLHLVHENTLKPVVNPALKALLTSKPESGGHSDAVFSSDGRVTPVSVTAAVIQIADQENGVVLMLRDVTKQRQIDAMKSEFMSLVSHELKTPLTCIKAYTEMLLDDAMEENSRNEYLEIIQEQSNKLEEMVIGLLEIGKIESTELSQKSQEINLCKVANSVLAEIKPIAEQKNVEIFSAIDSFVYGLVGDESKIEIMLTNLLSNAVKFTNQDGKVYLEIANQDDKIVIKVSDTGLGIPEEDIPKLWDKFFRVKRQGVNIPGTGLGLPIVKKVVDLHKGRIEVHSRVDYGTTFSIYLPSTKNSEEDESGFELAEIAQL